MLFIAMDAPFIFSAALLGFIFGSPKSVVDSNGLIVGQIRHDVAVPILLLTIFVVAMLDIWAPKRLDFCRQFYF